MSDPEGAPERSLSRGEIYVVVQFLLFALVAFGPRTLPGLPLWSEGLALPSLILGVVVLLAGGGLATLGIVHLGANLSPLPHPREGATLVDRGVYALARHPIYGGLLLGALGWAAVGRSSAGVVYAALLWGLFELKARREEAQLVRALPGYAGYRGRVRKFLPWIY